MKQWVEPESTKAENETFGNRSEDKLTTKAVGLDNEEETEEALILTSLGMHSKSMQSSECTGAWGLLANFLPQRPELGAWWMPHWPSWGKPLLCKVWPSDRPSQCDQLFHRLDKACYWSSIGIPGGWVYCPYQVCLNSQSSLAVKYWSWAPPSSFELEFKFRFRFELDRPAWLWRGFRLDLFDKLFFGSCLGVSKISHESSPFCSQ